MGLKLLRRRSRLSFQVLLLVTIALIILVIIFREKFLVYNPVGYAIGSISCWRTGRSDGAKPIGSAVEDKILVIPTLASTDSSWVALELPDWQRAIYIVNPSPGTSPASSLATPMNKGHEAMAYITYIIDHYNSTIPSVVAFLHSHRNGYFEAWHVDTPTHDNVMAMRLLRLEAVREAGYVNLRCNWHPGCSTRRVNGHVTAAVWDDLMGGTSTPVFNDIAGVPGAVASASKSYPPGLRKEKGLMIFSTCCAQFAVSRERIYQRPLEDYIQIRDWLMRTPLDDGKSGRVLEYMWHIIFGMEAMHCPDQRTCYCKLYGRC